MKMTQAALAALIALAAVGANAASVTATVGTQSATDFTLTASDVTGGKLLTGSVSGVAAAPTGTVGAFVAGEPGSSAVVTLGDVSSVSFEWGSPDSWNKLLVNLSNGTSETFLASTLGLASTSYVDFAAAAGLEISSLTFVSTLPAFEAANFKVSAVPEPTNVALLLAGIGLIGTVARRRRV